MTREQAKNIMILVAYKQFVRYQKQTSGLSYIYGTLPVKSSPACSIIDVALGSTAGYQLLVCWHVPIRQTLFLLLSQRKIVYGYVHRSHSLGIHRSEERAGDACIFKGAADQHPHSVGIEATPNIGRRLDDAASDKASPLIRQRAAGEGVGEDVVIQTRDTSNTIKRDGTGFRAKVSPGQVKNGLGYLLSLPGLDPAVTRTEHPGDGVDTNQGKAFGEGTAGKLPDGILHSLNPEAAFRYRNADVGVLVKHIFDWDEMLITLIMTVCKMKRVSLMLCFMAETMHTQSCRRIGQYDRQPCPRDGPKSLWRP